MDRIAFLLRELKNNPALTQREVADAVPVLHTSGWNMEAGGALQKEASPRVRSYMVQFQNLSTWDRHRYDKEGSISPEEASS